MTDPELHRLAMEITERLTAEDNKCPNLDSCGYFPGLAARLSVRSNDRIHERLKAQGLSGLELRTAFLQERDRLVNAGNLVAHEGRHALDMSEKTGDYTSAELEFRAKCSQVIFSSDPLLILGLGNIFSPEINPQGSGHGLADARIMKNLLSWMKSHAKEIPALDPSRPMLSQFDRLTDEQMREAFRSMDPWARTPNKTPNVYQRIHWKIQAADG
jgi:hypothetical protein